MQKELVSIVTPMYKGAKFVGETIEAVLKQTYANFEMIVVDDCSPDRGAGKAVVEKYIKKDSRIKLIALKQNRGSSGARNKGIEAAKGEFIAFLDSDDLWTMGFLEEQLLFMKEKRAAIVFSSYKRIDEDTKKEILPPFIVPEKVDYKTILKSLPIFPSSSVMNIGTLGKYYFNEQMGSLRDDYVYWLYLLKKHVDYAYGNQEVLVSYRLRKDSVTANKTKVIKPHWNVLRNVENLSLFESTYNMCWWICISLLKYRK